MPWKCTHYSQQDIYGPPPISSQPCSFLPPPINCHPASAYNRLDPIGNLRYRPQDYPVSSHI